MMNLMDRIEMSLRQWGNIIVIFVLYFVLFGIAEYLLTFASTISYCISFIIFLTFTILFVNWYIKRTGNRTTFAIKNIHWKIGLWSLLLCFSQFLLITVLLGNPYWKTKNDMSISFFIFSFGAVFCGPVVEEIVFRDLLQKQILKKIAPWLSILITSVLFSLVHYHSIARILPAFLVGIFCGIIYYKTDKLIICILFHALYNLIASMIQFRFDYDPIMQIASLILATGLSVYAIRSLLKIKVGATSDANTSINHLESDPEGLQNF
jgi:membrane protease YdiL (CAAX protease family)